jgi:hypothetical protein
MMNKKRMFVIFTFLAVLLLPASADVAVASGLTYEYEADIGETYTGVIQLQNSEDKPQEVKLYQNDYYYNFEGQSFYEDVGKVDRSNAKWFTYTPKNPVIPPKETLLVNFSVKVPSDPALRGTYWSMLMVEVIPEKSAESVTNPVKKEQTAVTIAQIMRYGCQIITQIGNTGKREVKFLNTKLSKEKDKLFLVVDVENTGERGPRASLWAEFYDNEGTFIGKYEGGNYRIFPGCSRRYKADITSIPFNKQYKVLVMLDCGGDDIFGVNLNLVLK